MIFSFPEFSFDIDIEKTRVYYETEMNVSERCTCIDCQNYEQAIDSFPKAVTSFFSQMGIDMKKFREVYVNCTNSDYTMLYGGFTHVCGKVISGKSAWIPASETSSYLDESNMHSITEDFRVYFNECNSLLDDNFPLPSIQIEISDNIDWVLRKPNNY